MYARRIYEVIFEGVFVIITGIFISGCSNQKKVNSIENTEKISIKEIIDDVGVKIVKNLGEGVVGFSVLGDAGATYSKEQILKAFINAKQYWTISF